MSYMESITAANDRSDHGQATVVEALRCYALARRDGRPALPAMIALAEGSGLSAPAAVALASVFEITESCLDRRLVPGEGAHALSDDERAVLRLIACPDAVGSHRGSATVPHGLPGVLVWAIRSARRLWPGARATFEPVAGSATCPFGGRKAWSE